MTHRFRAEYILYPLKGNEEIKFEVYCLDFEAGTSLKKIEEDFEKLVHTRAIETKRKYEFHLREITVGGRLS